MTDRFLVYALIRLDTGQPFYIGKGNWARPKKHFQKWQIGRNPHKDNIIRKMQKAGFDIPIITIRENLTEAAAFETEVALIKALGKFPNGPLVNVTDGGDGAVGYKHSKKALAKLRKPKSKATRLKLSKALAGRKLTQEHIAKLKAIKRKPRTAEWKQRLGLANLGKHHSQRTKKLLSRLKLGTRASQETKDKMRRAHLGKPSGSSGYCWTQAQKDNLRRIRQTRKRSKNQ